MSHVFNSSEKLFFCTGVSAKLDIIYLLDGSETVNQKTFSEIQRFVKGALKSYTVSSNKTRVGLITYGGMHPVRTLSVKGGTSVFTVEQSLPFMGTVGGKRNIEKALDSAAYDIIQNSKRKGVSKLIVLITTGKDEGKDVEKLEAVGKKLKDNGIKVAVVAIGKDVGKDGLPFLPFSVEGVMSVPSVDDLKKAVDFAEKAAAKATGKIVINNRFEHSISIYNIHRYVSISLSLKTSSR